MFHFWPYTNPHELNLDWIIATVKEYCERVEQAERNFADLKKYVGEKVAEWEQTFAKTLSEWDTKFTNVQQKWQEMFDQTQADWQEMFDQTQADWQTKFDTALKEWQDDFDAEIARWTELFNSYNTDITNKFNALSAEWTAYKTNLNQEWNDYKTSTTADLTEFKTNLTAEWNTYKTNLTNQFSELKTYCETYLENLDIYGEVSKKIDAMVADGSLLDLITPKLTDLTEPAISECRQAAAAANAAAQLAEEAAAGNSTIKVTYDPTTKKLTLPNDMTFETLKQIMRSTPNRNIVTNTNSPQELKKLDVFCNIMYLDSYHTIAGDIVTTYNFPIFFRPTSSSNSATGIDTYDEFRVDETESAPYIGVSLDPANPSIIYSKLTGTLPTEIDIDLPYTANLQTLKLIFSIIFFSSVALTLDFVCTFNAPSVADIKLSTKYPKKININGSISNINFKTVQIRLSNAMCTT